MARLVGTGGDVYLGLQTIHACDAAWDELVDVDVVATLDTREDPVDPSVKLAAAAPLINGDIMATDDVASMDLTTYNEVILRLKSSVNLAAASLQLLLDETAQCASPSASLNIPALAANVWKTCKIAQDMSGADWNAIISVGVKLTANDPGAFNLWVNLIQAAKRIAGIKAWELDIEYDVLDATGFDNSGVKAFKLGSNQWKGKFEGYKDGAPLIIGSAVNIELRESATATQQYRGATVIMGLHPKITHEGLVVYSYDFQGIGILEIPTT